MVNKYTSDLLSRSSISGCEHTFYSGLTLFSGNKKGLTVSSKPFFLYGVDNGTRTHDDRNHNPGLYQLSYIHH